MVSIALIGDFNPEVTAHRAIPLAIGLAAKSLGTTAGFVWLHTHQLAKQGVKALASYDGIWCVPGSPYANTNAAIAAIRFAREEGRAFLGTCGGFQHALLEFALNVLGMADASHAEIAPEIENPLISPLACSLVEQSGEIDLRRIRKRPEPMGERASRRNTIAVTVFPRHLSGSLALPRFALWDGTQMAKYELSSTHSIHFLSARYFSPSARPCGDRFRHWCEPF